MTLIIRMAAVLILSSIVACDNSDQPVKAVDTKALKTQMEALEQVNQVEQVVQDAAEQQRQKIDEETQ